MVKASSIYLVFAAFPLACSEELCAGQNCQQLDEDINGATTLLQFKTLLAMLSKTGACEKRTGGTCKYLACDEERHAECINDECVCPEGYCSEKGVCKLQTTTSTTSTTTLSQSDDEHENNDNSHKHDDNNDKCSVGAHVACPETGSVCSGDQCCPGTSATGGKSFPCPSAAASFSACQSPTKVHDCVVSFVQGEPFATIEETCTNITGGTCEVWSCDSSRNADCIGGQCFCREGFCSVGGECKEQTTTSATSKTKTTTVGGLGARSCSAGEPVTCPDTGRVCAGDQCCPGVTATGGKSFPCPSATAGYGGCESPTKLFDCLT